ncbi:hypothetical protein BCAH820_3676 [Bacillus cereus AH820]|uniref:Uncharacterized protein n=1 Tax=Bacillus cereus (strain AH820) TaxID=405535 RepID=B7JI94_BACC0|nr:hypothetical protein BCAH820_3676 [Bacillus cereus AH820]
MNAIFVIILLGGRVITCTWNEIVTESNGLRVPTRIPVDGFAFGTGMLLIVTLFGMNDVPAGSESVTEMSVTGMVPSFWNVIVNVIVSPTETMDLSAVFIGLIVPTFTGVIVVGVGVVTDTGGLVASGWYWNETLPWFWISPLGGIEVTRTWKEIVADSEGESVGI